MSDDCVIESSCYDKEPKGKKWMESKHWQESQPKPQHRQSKMPGIKGVRDIWYDIKVVTYAKMKFE